MCDNGPQRKKIKMDNDQVEDSSEEQSKLEICTVTHISASVPKQQGQISVTCVARNGDISQNQEVKIDIDQPDKENTAASESVKFKIEVKTKTDIVISASSSGPLKPCSPSGETSPCTDPSSGEEPMNVDGEGECNSLQFEVEKMDTSSQDIFADLEVTEVTRLESSSTMERVGEYGTVNAEATSYRGEECVSVSVETVEEGREYGTANGEATTPSDDEFVSEAEEAQVAELTEGLELDALPRSGVDPVPPQMPRALPSKSLPMHTVCVHMRSMRPGALPQPFPEAFRDAWDNRHVKLPWSKENVYPVQVKGKKELMSRWEHIKSKLQQLKSNIDSPGCNSTLLLRETVLSYNQRFKDHEGWSFEALQLLVEDFDAEEKMMFDKQFLPGLVDLCLLGPKEITSRIPLLKTEQNGSITLSQHQISVLLANAFFCTFPRRNNTGKENEYRNYPDINFNRMLSCCEKRQAAQMEKLKSIIAYFRHVMNSPSTGLVTFTRRSVDRRELPAWQAVDRPLSGGQLRISSQGTIEDQGVGMLQIDFANRMVGGGVIGQGLAQEEIRFLVCPELIVSRLFTESLGDTEVLLMHGAQQYSRYTGYADSFKYAGPFEDQREVDHSFRRDTTIVALDAINFFYSKDQYKDYHIRRELNKAYVGFMPTHPDLNKPDKLNAVATGNWGCGAFRGDPQLKFLIQLMAAAVNGRKLCYLTFRDTQLVRNGWRIYKECTENQVTVGSLYNIITSFQRSKRSVSLLDYVSMRISSRGASPDIETGNHFIVPASSSRPFQHRNRNKGKKDSWQGRKTYSSVTSGFADGGSQNRRSSEIKQANYEAETDDETPSLTPTPSPPRTPPPPPSQEEKAILQEYLPKGEKEKTPTQSPLEKTLTHPTSEFHILSERHKDPGSKDKLKISRGCESPPAARDEKRESADCSSKSGNSSIFNQSENGSLSNQSEKSFPSDQSGKTSPSSQAVLDGQKNTSVGSASSPSYKDVLISGKSNPQSKITDYFGSSKIFDKT